MIEKKASPDNHIKDSGAFSTFVKGLVIHRLLIEEYRDQIFAFSQFVVEILCPDCILKYVRRLNKTQA